MEKSISKTHSSITDEQVKILVQAGIIPPETPKAIIEVFGQTCSLHGLNPVKKEVFLLPYNAKVVEHGKEKWIVKYATIVGRDGLRTKAQRTGQLAGIDQPVFDDNKTIAMFKDGEKPVSCTVTVYRLVHGQKCAFTASVRFSEFSSGKQKWASMPFHMIAKVAECHALKMAFGEETAGLNVEEEMAAFQEIKEEITNNDLTEIIDSLDHISDIQSLNQYFRQLSDANIMTPEIRNLFSERKHQIVSKNGTEKVHA